MADTSDRHGLGESGGPPLAERRSDADQAIADMVAFIPGSIVLGHGSFFRGNGRGSWGDIDLLVLTKDQRRLRKTRSAYRGEVFDVTWCGLENLDAALAGRAAIGHADLARAIATSKLLHGDEAPAARAQRQARAMLEAGPMPGATALADRLRLRLTLRLDDRERLPTAQRAIATIEDCAPTFDLGMLNRNQWIVSVAYSDLWSAEARRFVTEIEKALKIALSGDDSRFLTIVGREVSSAGGALRRWPVDLGSDEQHQVR